MKEILLGNEVQDYILKLIKENEWEFVFGDNMEFKNLCSLVNSCSLNNKELLIKFDVNNSKLKKEHIDFILKTKHHVIVVADELKKIPVQLRKIGEVKKFEILKKVDVMSILNTLGTKDVDMEEVKKYPIGQIIKYLNVNWDKLEGSKELYDLLVEVNKRLYKVGDDYLYLYLIWGFPKQKRKTFFRYPVSYKYAVKDSIVKKVSEHYGFSLKEVNGMWWLIRRLITSDMAEEMGFSNEDKKLLGIKINKKIKLKKDVTKDKKSIVERRYGNLLG